MQKFYAIVEVRCEMAVRKVLGKRIVDYNLDVIKAAGAAEIFVLVQDEGMLGYFEGCEGVTAGLLAGKDEIAAGLDAKALVFDGASIIFKHVMNNSVSLNNSYYQYRQRQSLLEVEDIEKALRMSRVVDTSTYDMKEFSFIQPNRGFGEPEIVVNYQYLQALDGQFLGHIRSSLNLIVTSKHEENGVLFWEKYGANIDWDVEIGAGTEILPGVIITGKTTIGNNCQIGPYCVIKDSEIGDGCEIGPFVHIRPESELGDKVKLGNFVEVKKSKIGKGSKANHLSYLGDSVIGEGVNIGCGTVTVNYDGKHKHVTTIEDGAFVGCNSNLVAPVTIGERAYVAAGSTIYENVPKGLGIARAKQRNIEDWTPPKDRI